MNRGSVIIFSEAAWFIAARRPNPLPRGGEGTRKSVFLKLVSQRAEG